MKKTIFLAFLFFTLNTGVASASVTFTPSSPQNYDGTSDINIANTVESGGSRLFVFRPDGSSIGCASDAIQTDEPYTTKYPSGAGCPGGTFQSDMGAAGTVHFVLANLSGSWIATCELGTYSTCLAGGSYAGTDEVFELTTPGPTPTTTPSVSRSDGIFMWGAFMFALCAIMWKFMGL